MTENERARAAKRATAADHRATFYNGYRADVRTWKLEPDDQIFLKKIVTGRLADRALLCNENVRVAMQNSIIDALIAEYESDPDRKRYWVTIAWDLGVTMERSPSLDLVAIRNTAQHHLRRAGLEGFGVIEFDVWKNLTGELGRRLVAHVHFLGAARNPACFRQRAVETEMRTRRGLTNSIGSHSVVIKRVRPGIANLVHLGMYMSKAPGMAKNLVRVAKRSNLWSARLPRGSAARLIEIFSNIEVGDVMFAIGSGQRISRPVNFAIRQAIRPRAGRTAAPTAENVRRHWRRIRLINGNPLFREPIIITRTRERKIE